MDRVFDPCNPSLVSSACVVTLAGIGFLQVSGYCLPVLDYIKFVTICVIMYFYYQVVLKLKPALCGMNGASMWSCVCLSMLISIGIMTALCVRFKQAGEIGGYAALIFCFLPYTLCCLFRMYGTGGPLDKDFWDPSTMMKVYM